MTAYYRGSDAEPTKEELCTILSHSCPSDWLYDRPSRTYTYRDNLLIFLIEADEDRYCLRYGYSDVAEFEFNDVKRNIINSMGSRPRIVANGFTYC